MARDTGKGYAIFLTKPTMPCKVSAFRTA